MTKFCSDHLLPGDPSILEFSRFPTLLRTGANFSGNDFGN